MIRTARPVVGSLVSLDLSQEEWTEANAAWAAGLPYADVPPQVDQPPFSLTAQSRSGEVRYSLQVFIGDIGPDVITLSS